MCMGEEVAACCGIALGFSLGKCGTTVLLAVNSSICRIAYSYFLYMHLP